MSFPQTRLTLIRRLADGGGDDDWRQFVTDYWRPVCRFAGRWGNLQPSDAEDVAGATFETLIRNRLLSRWSNERTAKLRTLLCAVVRRQLANRRRSKQNQQQQFPSAPTTDFNESPTEVDVPNVEREAFEELWVDEILARSLDSVQQRCLRDGKGDQFRVLYGRICEGMTHAEVADCLGVELTTVQAWYKRCRDQLAEALRAEVYSIVSQYSPVESYDDEFRKEWEELAERLRTNGGLEAAIRRSHDLLRESSTAGRHLDSGRLDELRKLARSVAAK